tara:strand:+ start:6131 stop:7288 length:1158 start_codon:yes stop_codon:yes gene_type:complete
MTWEKYYKKNKILPNIDLGDHNLRILYKHRKSFYNSIGLNILDFKNKSFLELAPGSGYNAFFLLNHGIKKIDLVDFNPEAIKKINQNLKKFKSKFSVKKEDITLFNTKKKYDFVLIENALFNVKNPQALLKKLFNFVKKGGYLIVTTSDQFSLFSEKLRGLLSHLIITKKLKNKNFNDKTKYLAKFFDSHLKTLKSHTRTPDLWVQDNILHYGSFTERKYFPIDRIIMTLNERFKKRFVIWKTSPDFLSLFKWYRLQNKEMINSKVSKDYLDNLVNFLHIDEKFNLSIVNKKKINKLISSVNSKINQIKEGKDLSKKFLRNILKRIISLSTYLNRIKKHNKISKSLNELVFFAKNLNSQKKSLMKLKNFKKFWGHGTFILAINKE